MKTSDSQFPVRAAVTADIAALARIWFEGWHKAHHDTLPSELRQHRTEASFTGRLTAELHAVRVIDCDGQVNGFAILNCTDGNDRAVRFYETSGWRNTGVADIGLLLAPNALADCAYWPGRSSKRKSKRSARRLRRGG